MSEGPRVPLADADRAAAFLFDRWALDPATCMVVGSVRRRRPDVGDIELVAPSWDSSGTDGLYHRIAATMEPESLPKLRATPDGSLFAPSEPATATKVCAKPIGRVLQGLKPAFLHARLLLRRRDGSELPCEVYRYTPDNRGWCTIQRTGPREFGICFLVYWKHRLGIPIGEQNGRTQEGSIGGHLVDAAGAVVPVPTEAAAFARAGVPWIAPEDRDKFAADWMRQQGGGKR